MTGVPATRTLTAVLRDALNNPPALQMVTAEFDTPDPSNAYCNVIVQGQTIRVPKLRTVTADPGAVAYLLTTKDFVLCVGSVSTVPDQQLATGTSYATFPNNTIATALAVTHNLGRVPTAVVCQPYTSPGPGAAVVTIYPQNLTTTQFTAQGVASVTQNGTVTFVWLAIG